MVPSSASSRLAARLSYFLWSSMPDDELYRLAARGELRRGENLPGQVRRMLRDEKARALVGGFAEQWLQVRSVREVTPDPLRFPDFDEPLRRAMLMETSRFAGAILLEDGNVFDFLDASYTFANERLARHYGIPGVVGDEFRRVSLAGTGRGGVLTHASILTVTSNPTRTSPVKRGKWVLDNLLAMPPPPPPGGSRGLEGRGRPPGNPGRSGSGWSGTATTRNVPRATPGWTPSASPWRASMPSAPGDPPRRASRSTHRGRLPAGEPFEGASGLRAVLEARRGSFARCLAEKLLTYALGRGLGQPDRCSVDEIVRKLDRGDGRSSALILAVVESPPFQQRSRSKESR